MSNKKVNVSVLFADAITDVPGFDRIIWNAACSLMQVHESRKETREYEATHKTRGKAYQRAARLSDCSASSFDSFVTSACAILEAMASSRSPVSDSLEMLIFYAVHEEVSEIAESASYKDIYGKLHGWA